MTRPVFISTTETFAKPHFFLIVLKNKFLNFQLVIFFEICEFRGFAKVSCYKLLYYY